MSKSLQKTKNYYNGIAKGYSNLYKEEQIKKINTILKYLPFKGNVLDLGCGDGVLNDYLDLKSIKLFSFDLSIELLKLNSNIETQKFQGDAQDLSIFKNGYFDNVLSFSVLQDIVNPILAINEVIRVLKNKGMFIVSILKFGKNCEIISKYLEQKFKLIEKIEEEKDIIFVLKLEL